MNLHEWRKELERRKGELAYIQSNLNKNEENLVAVDRDIKRHELALTLFREVCQATQQQVEVHLSDLVSLAMNAVFDDPYELSVNFVQRRGKTECDLAFKRDKEIVDPLSSAGYGAVDVAAFALRVASWFLSGKRSRNLFVLDEPFKHLKGIEQNRRVLSMVKQISKMLDLQIIMVSDERVPKEDIIEGADRVFEVSKDRRGVSHILTLEG
jgi:hypothetical protein